MKTCELCGERLHDGPCYADLRADWKQQDIDRFFGEKSFHVMNIEGENYSMHKIAYKVTVLK